MSRIKKYDIKYIDGSCRSSLCIYNDDMYILIDTLENNEDNNYVMEVYDKYKRNEHIFLKLDYVESKIILRNEEIEKDNMKMRLDRDTMIRIFEKLLFE